jgi:hypothetical protein
MQIFDTLNIVKNNSSERYRYIIGGEDRLKRRKRDIGRPTHLGNYLN